MSEHAPVEKGNHVNSLHEPARMAWRKMQCIDDPGQLALPVSTSTHITVGRQIGAMLRLAIDFVCDYQSVLTDARNIFIDALQEMLQYH